MRKILFVASIIFGFGLYAQAKDFTVTGSGVRVKKIAFVSVKVYSITHSMKDVPAKNAQEIINADTDKKFVLKMMRDIEAEKIANAFKEAYGNNGYSNAGNISTISSVLSGDLKEGDTITFSYNSANKTVSLTSGGKTSNVAGVDFMKATWSIWFGKIDQPDLTQNLMSKIP